MMQDIALFKNVPTGVKDLFFALGIIYILYKVISLLHRAIDPFFHFEKNMAKRYGKGSWAVVTGGSDGIGKEYCYQLAKRDFNIVIIARNEEKTKAVAEDVMKKYPNIKARVVVADFANSAKEGFFENIYEQLKSLDISMIVVNAALPVLGALHTMPYNVARDMIIVNCMPQVMLARYFIPQMLKRKEKSAFISISSFAASFVRPYEGLYSATKVFMDFFSRAIAEEYPQLDILCVKPGLVSTRLLNWAKPDLRTCTTADFVNTSLRYLGRKTHTHGHWKHRLTAWTFEIMPEWLRMNRLIARSKNLKEIGEK